MAGPEGLAPIPRWPPPRDTKSTRRKGSGENDNARQADWRGCDAVAGCASGRRPLLIGISRSCETFAVALGHS